VRRGSHATTKASDVASALIIPPLVLQAAQLLLVTLHDTERARTAREAVPYATAEIVAAEVHWRGRVPTFETLSCCHDGCV